MDTEAEYHKTCEAVKARQGAVPIGDLLASRLNLKSATLSKCKCGRPADALFGHCHICYNKATFEVMPDEEKQLRLQSVVPARFMSAELAHLPEKLIEIIKALSDEKGLYLWGAQGRGKTYAMAAIAKMYITQGFNVERVVYEMLCLRLRDTIRKNSEQTEYGIIKPLLEADKLFIEDVGTTKSENSIESDFSLRTLLVLIDCRLENCKATFITTNRSIEELAKTFDERITSRLQQGCRISEYKGFGRDRREPE